MRKFVRQIHFVGIGGAGMSGIASVLLDQDYKVSGADRVDSSTLQRLREQGAIIGIGHRASQVKNADVVVVSSVLTRHSLCRYRPGTL